MQMDAGLNKEGEEFCHGSGKCMPNYLAHVAKDFRDGDQTNMTELTVGTAAAVGKFAMNK